MSHNTTTTFSLSSLQGNDKKQIIFNSDPFDFTKPFVPSVKIESFSKNKEDEIILTSTQENIFYLQRKLQTDKSLDKDTFFESILNLTLASDVSVKPAINDVEKKKYASIPIYASLDYAQRFFKIIFFIQYSLSNRDNLNNTEEFKKKHMEILLTLKKITLLNYKEFEKFTEKFYNKLGAKSHLFKLKLMNTKKKLLSKLNFDDYFNELINIDMYRIFFIKFISFLRLNAVFFLGLIKNVDKMNDGILKKMLIDISNMRIVKSDKSGLKNITLKELEYTDFVPIEEELQNDKTKIMAKTYKIKILLEFSLLVGNILYNYFGSSDINFNKNISNKDYFKKIINSITRENPLFENIFKITNFQDTLILRNLENVLSEYLQNNETNILILNYKMILFYQLYSTISWFFITPGSIYEVIGFDTVYDKPLLDQYITASFIGKRLVKAGQESIESLTPISTWSLLWTKNSGINKRIRLYNIQFWSFTIISMNYEGEHYHPIGIAANKTNMAMLQKSKIPKNFFNAKDEYQYHFLTKYCIENIINDSVYGTLKDSILTQGGVLENFLTSIGWVKDGNKNKIDINKILKSIFSGIFSILNNKNKENFLKSLENVNDYKYQNFKIDDISLDDLKKSLNTIQKNLLKQNFIKMKELIDFIKLRLNNNKIKNKLKLSYYILYVFIFKLPNFNDIMLKDFDVIDYTPFSRIKSRMLKYKIINPKIIQNRGAPKIKSLNLFPIELRENNISDKLIKSEFYITDHGYIIRTQEMKEGEILLKQMTIKNIEFVLVKKIKNKSLENKKSNSDNDYSIDIYNHEFYVVKVQPGSREVVILGIINMNVDLIDEDHNPKNKSNKNGEKIKKMNESEVFNPYISEDDKKRHISKVRKNILDSFKNGNDKFIDIKIGDTVISPLDLTFMIILCKYLMTKTGAGIAFGQNKFTISHMLDYDEIFNSDGTTNYESSVVKHITEHGLRSSFTPLSLFNPKSSMNKIIY